jgi:hypothetical protein
MRRNSAMPIGLVRSGSRALAQLPAVSGSGGRVDGAKALPGRDSSTLVCCPKCSHATPAMAAMASTTTRNPNISIAHRRGRGGRPATSAFDTGSRTSRNYRGSSGNGRYGGQPREFLIQRIEVRQKVQTPHLLRCRECDPRGEAVASIRWDLRCDLDRLHG